MTNEQRKLYLNAGIYEEYLDLSLDAYRGNVPERALWIVEKYISEIHKMKKEGLGLYFYGPPGTGKTGLMMEILKAAVDSGFTAQFGTLGGITTKFSDAWYAMEARQDFLKYVRNIEFLGIDDIGKELETRKGLETVVFDSVIRYRSMRNRPIIQTSNISAEEIQERYSEYIVSLMYGKMIPIHLEGEDFRQKKALGNIEVFMEGWRS